MNGSYRAAVTCDKLCGRPPQYAPAPYKLTFDLLTFKMVSESRVTWDTSMPILVSLGLSVLDLDPVYATDRYIQTDVWQHHCLMPPPRVRVITKYASWRKGALCLKCLLVESSAENCRHCVCTSLRFHLQKMYLSWPYSRVEFDPGFRNAIPIALRRNLSFPTHDCTVQTYEIPRKRCNTRQ